MNWRNPLTMKMIDRQIAGVTVVDIRGRIVLGEETAQLRNTIRDLIARGKKNILLNLGEVPYIDSSGIGELVSAFTAVRREGGDVKLLSLTKKVRDVLQIVKVLTIFDVFDYEPAALNAFARQEKRAS
jgi:anti-sigma B factor antagonist